MTDDNSISRRSMLAATGTLGLTSLAGCLDPSSDSWILSEDSGFRPDPSAEMKNITVREAPRRTDPYFVALSDDILSSSEVTVFDGQQIRMKVQSEVEGDYRKPCLYTVNTDPEYTSEEETTVWMSKDGLDRLGVVEGTSLVLQPYSASPIFETRDAGEENNELIEQYIDKSESRILFIAPHGGDMFSNTELQAIRGSSIENYSSWALMGYAKSREESITRWYNPPEDYLANSFLGLLELNGPFDYTVSFTGMNLADDATNKEVVIGGLAEDSIKESIRSELIDKFTPGSEDDTSSEQDSTSEDSNQSDNTQQSDENSIVEVSIAYEGNLSDSEPQHIANSLSNENSNGIVIHQTKKVRSQHWREVTDAVMTAIEENSRD